MKKFIVAAAIAALTSASAFAQTAPAPVETTAAPVTVVTPVDGPRFAGLSVGSLIAVGIAVAVVAAAVSDSDEATSHASTTHHGK